MNTKDISDAKREKVFVCKPFVDIRTGYKMVMFYYKDDVKKTIHSERVDYMDRLCFCFPFQTTNFTKRNIKSVIIDGLFPAYALLMTKTEVDNRNKIGAR